MYPIPVSALPVSGTMGLISAISLHYVRLWLAKDIYNPSKSPFDKGDFWVVYSIHYVRLWLAKDIYNPSKSPFDKGDFWVVYSIHYVRLWFTKDIYNPSKSPFIRETFGSSIASTTFRLWLANNICRLTTITTDYYTNLRGSEGVAPPNYGAKLYYF